MPEPTTDELQEQFTAARVGGDYATMERIGRQLYPEPGEERGLPDAPEGGAFLQTLRTRYRLDGAPEDVDRMEREGTVRRDEGRAAFKTANEAAFRKEDAAPGLTLQAIDQRLAEIDAADAPGRLQLERVRQAHGVERNQLLQRRYAVIEAMNAGAALPPVARVELPPEERTPADRPAQAEVGRGVPDVGPAPEGHTWAPPVVEMLAEDLVGRHVVSEDVFTQLARQGTALFTARQAKGQTEPIRLDAAQRDDIEVVVPDRLQREHLVEFVEKTGLAEDEMFDTILAREADLRRKELEGGRALGLKLATMNQGSKEYAALAEQRNAHYKRFYEGA